MKRWLLLILCLAFLPSAVAFAQQTNDPATKEDVQQLFDLMQSRKQFDSLIEIFKKQIPALTESTLQKQLPNATPEETARMNEFTNGMVEKMFTNMPFDELMDAMKPAYEHHFTHGEMQALIQFYSSPVGKKMIADMPSIMAEYMQGAQPIMQKWMADQMAEMQASAEQYAKELKAKKATTESSKGKS